MLYAASWRAALALGYRRLITYTQAADPGASLRRRLAGGRRTPAAGQLGHARPSPHDRHPTGVTRTLWEASRGSR
jgi:hypothetical protein